MKFLLFMIARNLVSLSMVITAGYLVAHDKPGWGWFLGFALLLTATPKGKVSL